MCLLVIAIDQTPDLPLIFLSNRDEFYARETVSMHWWKDQEILAGRDLKAGGTWLGINSKQHIAAVTNFRNLQHQRADAPTRGSVPTNLLLAQPKSFTEHVKSKEDEWSLMNGFNLFYYNGHNFYHYSNVSKKVTQLSKGIYAISNADLDTPWPKVVHIKKYLTEAIEQNDISTNSLLDILKDTQPYPEENLPDTGVGLEMEKVLSPICIQSPVYGTRTHTIITQSSSQEMKIYEEQTLTQVHKEYRLSL